MDYVIGGKTYKLAVLGRRYLLSYEDTQHFIDQDKEQAHGWRCTCADWHFRQEDTLGMCKHIAALADGAIIMLMDPERFLKKEDKNALRQQLHGSDRHRG